MFTYLFTYLHVYFKNDLLSKNCKRMESSNDHFAQLFLQMDQEKNFKTFPDVLLEPVYSNRFTRPVVASFPNTFRLNQRYWFSSDHRSDGLNGNSSKDGISSFFCKILKRQKIRKRIHGY